MNSATTPRQPGLNIHGITRTLRRFGPSGNRRIPRPVLLLAMAAIIFTLSGCAGGVHDTSRTFHTVVIDAGHGGHDSGATTRYGGREKDSTLDVVRRLEPKLQAAGFHTVMTRNSDRFIPLD